MPRLLTRPPKLRRHASGQAFVSVSGRSIYLGKWGSPESRAAYREFKRNWKPAPLVAMVSDRDDEFVSRVAADQIQGNFISSEPLASTSTPFSPAGKNAEGSVGKLTPTFFPVGEKGGG